MNGIVNWDRPDYQDQYDGHRCEDPCCCAGCGLPCDRRFCPSCLDEAAYELAGLREEFSE